MNAWERFRSWRWGWQALAWVFIWPVPLLVWALSKDQISKRAVALAIAGTVAWLGIVVTQPGGTSPTQPFVAPVFTQTIDPSTPPLPSVRSVEPRASPTKSLSSTPSPTRSASPTTPLSARAMLDSIAVRAERDAVTYDRDAFKHWIDADHDGCDTRAEVLMSESVVKTTRNPDTCRILTGRWFSLYDGETVTVAGDLDVDHVVALAEAWRSGASRWSDDRREDFANDLSRGVTLRAVTASTNRSKGDRDPSDWAPPRHASWCRYAKDWIAVKHRWKLSADPPEVDALEEMLAAC